MPPPQYVSYFYNLISNFKRIIEWKYIKLSKKQINEIINSPFEKKIIAIEWLIENDEKIWKLRSHQNSGFINEKDYKKLAMMTPLEVSNILIKIQYLRGILEDWFIDDEKFERIMNLPLEKKIIEINSLENEVQAKRTFKANSQDIKETNKENLLRLLSPKELNIHSNNLALVDSLFKSKKIYISKSIYIYLKNLGLNELGETLFFLTDIIDKIEKGIKSLVPQEKKLTFLENSEQIQAILEGWIKNLEEYEKLEKLESEEILQKLKASFSKNIQ